MGSQYPQTNDIDDNGGTCCTICLEPLFAISPSVEEGSSSSSLSSTLSLSLNSSNIGASVPCGHCFHSDCFRQWISVQQYDDMDDEQTTTTCPLCKVASDFCFDLTQAEQQQNIADDGNKSLPTDDVLIIGNELNHWTYHPLTDDAVDDESLLSLSSSSSSPYVSANIPCGHYFRGRDWDRSVTATIKQRQQQLQERLMLDSTTTTAFQQRQQQQQQQPFDTKCQSCNGNVTAILRLYLETPTNHQLVERRFNGPFTHTNDCSIDICSSSSSSSTVDTTCSASDEQQQQQQQQQQQSTIPTDCSTTTESSCSDMMMLPLIDGDPLRITVNTAGIAAVHGEYIYAGVHLNTNRYIRYGIWNNLLCQFNIVVCHCQYDCKHWYISILLEDPSDYNGIYEDIDFYKAPIVATTIPPQSGWDCILLDDHVQQDMTPPQLLYSDYYTETTTDRNNIVVISETTLQQHVRESDAPVRQRNNDDDVHTVVDSHCNFVEVDESLV